MVTYVCKCKYCHSMFRGELEIDDVCNVCLMKYYPYKNVRLYNNIIREDKDYEEDN